MPETAVGRPLLRILQDVVGFIDLLELQFERVVPVVAIRMVLHGELAKGAFQRAIVGTAGNAENFVEIALGHRIRSGQSKGPPGLPDGPLYVYAERLRSSSGISSKSASTTSSPEAEPPAVPSPPWSPSPLAASSW